MRNNVSILYLHQYAKMSDDDLILWHFHYNQEIDFLLKFSPEQAHASHPFYRQVDLIEKEITRRPDFYPAEEFVIGDVNIAVYRTQDGT